MSEFCSIKMRFRSTLQGSQRVMNNAEASASAVSKTGDLNCNNVNSADSFMSNVEHDFIQENTDYQWFIDYGYRDGSSLHRSSILSSSCYDDLSRDLDANLAHVDMEDFSHEDIHTLLHTLPPISCRDIQERQGEMYASVSRSLINKFELDSSLSQHSSSQEESALSLCKSGPLFSPLKEPHLPPPGSISVDSLDCDDQHMLITCHPNKHNYTIAFQGSAVMSNSSGDPNQAQGSGDESTKSNTSSSMDKPKPKWMSELRGSSEMTNSDSPLTTWSKLKNEPGTEQGKLSRHPSGNNNSAPIGQTNDNGLNFKPLQSACSVPSLIQTQSLPNLVFNKQQQWLLRSKLLALNGSITSAEKTLDVPIKIFDIDQSTSNSLSESNYSGRTHPSVSNSFDTVESTASNRSGSSSSHNNNNNNNSSKKKHTTTPSHQPNFSLLKLFIKQKSDHHHHHQHVDVNHMSWNETEDETAQQRVSCGGGATVTAAAGGVMDNNNCRVNQNVTAYKTGANENVLVYANTANKDNTDVCSLLDKQTKLGNYRQSENSNYNFHSTNTKLGRRRHHPAEEREAEEVATEELLNDNETLLSISQTQSNSYCDCEEDDLTESFSSHTNRPITILSNHNVTGRGTQSENTSREMSSEARSGDEMVAGDTSGGTGRKLKHREQCPMFDKGMQTSTRQPRLSLIHI